MKINKIIAGISERQRAAEARASQLFGVDVVTNTRAGRIGRALITTAIAIEFVMPVLMVVGMFALSAVSTVAQVPGGNIFGNSAETPGRGLVEAVKYARNVVFIAGIAFFIWAGLNMGFEKPWGGKAWAGAACWGFSGLAALVYEFSQGNPVNLDTGGLGR